MAASIQRANPKMRRVKGLSRFASEDDVCFIVFAARPLGAESLSGGIPPLI